MPYRIHSVILTPEEKEKLEGIAYSGTHSVRQIINARLLLKSAEGQTDAQIADALDISLSGVAGIRKRFAQKGLDACLHRAVQENRPRKITGDIEARITQLACSPAPEGRSHWTIDLLRDRIVELKILPSIGRATVQRLLKKTKSNPGS